MNLLLKREGKKTMNEKGNSQVIDKTACDVLRCMWSGICKKKKKSWIKSEKSKIHSMTFPLKRILENVFS